VVGLVRDAKYNDLQQAATPTIYADCFNRTSLVISAGDIRTRIDPGRSCQRRFARTKATILKDVPIVRIMTHDRADRFVHCSQRLIAMLSAGFGALGAMLASHWPVRAYSRTRSRGAHMRSAFAWRSVQQGLMLCAWSFARPCGWSALVSAIGAPLAYWGNA